MTLWPDGVDTVEKLNLDGTREGKWPPPPPPPPSGPVPIQLRPPTPVSPAAPPPARPRSQSSDNGSSGSSGPWSYTTSGSHLRPATSMHLEAYWACQMNIIPGNWVTPWRASFDYNGDHSVAEKYSRIMPILLQCLFGLLDTRTLRFTKTYKQENSDWLKNQKETFSPYAINAMGGVVVSGNYQGVQFPMFEQALPAIEFYHSWEHQVDPSHSSRTEELHTMRQLELTVLDSWLSLAGRTEEISSGDKSLIKKTPSFVDRGLKNLSDQCETITAGATTGGLQAIQDVADKFIGYFVELKFTDAEIVFSVMAMIRAVKVVYCIETGQSSSQLQRILKVDIPVYLV